MPGTEGSIITGAYTHEDIPSVLLKYDRDKDYAGMIVYINRGTAPLTYILREKLPKVQVATFEPVLPQVNERPYKFTLASNGPTGSANVMLQTLTFNNEDAKNLQKNDFLTVDGIFYNGTTWSTTFSATSGPREVIRVDSIGTPGTTTTPVVVERGWGGAGTGTPTQITTSMKLVLTTSAVGEGSRSRAAIGRNIQTETNYVQLFREPFEATDFELDEDTFFNERPEQVNANLASTLLLKKIEFTFINGRRQKRIDGATNRVTYTTGGIAEFIPRDTDHHIQVTFSQTMLNDVLRRCLSLGGSDERWLIGGLSFVTNFNNTFVNNIWLNQPLSDRYRLNIKTYEGSVGGQIHVIPSFAMTELGYDNEAFVLDLGDEATPYFQYMYIDDVFINTGPDGKGIQLPDEFIRKEEFVAKIGLIRRAADYQVHLYV